MCVVCDSCLHVRRYSDPVSSSPSGRGRGDWRGGGRGSASRTPDSTRCVNIVTMTTRVLRPAAPHFLRNKGRVNKLLADVFCDLNRQASVALLITRDACTLTEDELIIFLGQKLSQT